MFISHCPISHVAGCACAGVEGYVTNINNGPISRLTFDNDQTAGHSSPKVDLTSVGGLDCSRTEALYGFTSAHLHDQDVPHIHQVEAGCGKGKFCQFQYLLACNR